MKRIKMTADEEEAFSRNWRGWFNWKPHELKKIKRRYHKRERLAGKREKDNYSD